MVRRILPQFLLVAGSGFSLSLLAANVSSWAFPGASGRLLLQPDALGNRILDYSSVGYKGGTVPLPNVPVKATLSPVAGDNGAHIQNAINQVAALPLDTNGFRGAVLLSAGEYPIAGTITINASGVVLRGAGDSPGGTVLRATGAGQRSLIRITGSGSPSESTVRNITNPYVPVGARSFNVDSASGLAVGDRVFVRRNANQQWIDDLGMNLLDNPWTPSGYVINADRFITRIEGNRIFINAPITCAIEQKYGGGSVREYTFGGRIQNVGIEYLRGVSDFVSADDEDHGWILIQVNSAEHVWVRNVTSQYFGYACVALYSRTLSATVRDCRSLNPVSIVTGGRRYAFVMDDSQLCLVENCYTHDDRHQFVTQSLTTGPNVFVDGLSDTARSDAGPHHRWATAALWDNVTVNGHQLNVRNRGNSGTGHGWAGANCVVWNSQANSFIVQSPPTARNWLIGSSGTLSTSTSGAVGPAPPGTYDSHGSNVFPNSLYYAQLQDRLAAPNLHTREYWFGDLDQFVPAGPAGDVVTADAAWRAAVQSAAGGAPLSGFDLVTNNHWVPFTFGFSLAGNEQVVAATLVLALRAAGSAANNDVLYLDDLTNSFTFSSLGWLPVGTGTNTTMRLLDLAGLLDLLADGKLDVAVQNDLGVDWALLELHVAPNLNAGTVALAPVADATVRGGASANSNFGSSTTLTLKEDPQADNDRKAYLRWDLSGVTGLVYQAKVRLTPVSVGLDGIEHGATVASSDVWTETGLTWNNQPGGGKRFATWIPRTNGPVEFVVTPQVLEALAGDKQLSMQLYSLRNMGGAGIAEYATREYPVTNLRPQLRLVMTGGLSPAASLIWNGVPGPDWDVGFTTNWLASGVAADYHQGDFVRFDDTAGGTGDVNLATTLTPGSLTVSNAAKSYSFSGAGRLSGFSGLVKQGPGMLAIANSGSNDFTGGVLIEGGTLRVGDGSNNGVLPAGSVINHGNLVFNRSDDFVSANVISGAGTVRKDGAGRLTLTGDNSFSGVLTVAQGTLKAGNNAALGSAGGATIINNGGTLDVNGLNLTGEPVTVSGVGTGGAGAVINSGAQQTSALRSVTLAGDATFGGTGRWDIRNTGGAASLVTGGQPWKITKVGTNQVSLVAVNQIDAALGDIDVQQGVFAIQTSTMQVGNPTRTLTVFGGATLNLWNLNTAPLNKRIVLHGNATVWNESGNSVIIGPVTLTNGPSTFNIGGTSLTLSNNTISGPGNLTKTGAGTLVLRGVNTYTGNTDINAGTLALVTTGSIASSPGITVAAGAVLDLSARSDGRLTLANGQSLMGNGALNGLLTVSPGATISPGIAIGAFTISNAVTLQGTTAMDLNPAAAGLQTNDVIRTMAGITYGGTLSLTNLGGALSAGDSFKLFAAAAYSGAFSALVPASPGNGLVWNTNSLTLDGTLRVIVAPKPVISSVMQSGDQLIVNGTNGVPNASYCVLVTTNLASPLANWMRVTTNVFDSSGSFSFTQPISPTQPQQFYSLQSP